MKLTTLLILVSSLAATFIVAACGLDLYVYLYPVKTVFHAGTGSTSETESYFSFETSDDDQDAAEFKGFEIVYRIYDSETTLATDVSNIDAYNDNNPTLIYSFLTNTKKYRHMRYVSSSTPLIPGTGTNRDVYLRLVKGSVSPDYDAAFTLDLIPQINGVAMRSVDQYPLYESFDFDEISSSDSDVTPTATDPEYWYVQMYVLAYGTDSSFTSIYSEAKSLGYALIQDYD